MVLRRYIAGEETAIWDVVFRATRESNARDYHPDLIDRWAPHDKDMRQWKERLSKKNPFVAIIDEAIIGMAELDDTGFIDYFYVRPEFQGGGVGKALLAAIESEADRAAIRRLFADVSVTAKPFFESNGFSVTAARTNIVVGHPAPNFAMTKTLNGDQD